MTRLSELKIKEIARKGRWSDNDPEITGVETHSLRIKKRDIFSLPLDVMASFF